MNLQIFKGGRHSSLMALMIHSILKFPQRNYIKPYTMYLTTQMNSSETNCISSNTFKLREIDLRPKITKNISLPYTE